jgi:hypothetical protein
VFVLALVGWLAGSLINGHLQRDLAPRMADLRNLPRDVLDHARLRFHHKRDYNTLQKLSYGAVLFIIMPAIIITGLAMSPTIDAVVPFLADMLGGRQTARAIHFIMMLLLVGFLVHIVMILLQALNELGRSSPAGTDRCGGERLMAKVRSPPPLPRQRNDRRRRPGAVGVQGWTDSRDSAVRRILASANDRLTGCSGGRAGAGALPRFSEADIRQPQRPNGVTAPDDDSYKALAATILLIGS